MNENNPLVTELMARAGGASVTEAAGSARAGSRGLGDLPARTTITVAAAVLAVVVIAATSWGLARHDDGKKSASPDAPESSEMTFGPNQPDTTPTTTYPTLPTFPEVSTPGFTTPTYPTASAPRPTYSTSAYSYPSSTTSYKPYSPYTPPTSSHTSASPTTDPSWSPPPSPTKVTPGAPTATKITRCGTWGRLTVPKTDSVRYDLTVGDGKQGRWVIRAFAKKGYEITSGATTRWSGNLGRFEKCLGISAVSVQDDSTSESWLVSVRLDVPKTETRTLRVIYEFEAEVVISGSQGSNWTCTGPDGREIVTGEELTVRPRADVTCRYAGSGRRPLVSLRLTDSVPPGSATLTANNGFVTAQPFAG